MSWRNNWLLAFPHRWRLLPPLLLAALGGTLLVWVHTGLPDGIAANVAPLIWFGIGVGLLVRPAQSLMVSAAAFGMTGLAMEGVLSLMLRVDMDLWRSVDMVRIVFWSVLAALALPAALGEALLYRPVLARRLYFAAVAVFFAEGGVRRLIASGDRASECVFFFLVAMFALFSVCTAERTVAHPGPFPERENEIEDSAASIGAGGGAPALAETEGSAIRTHRVRYLDEPGPPAGA
jgi:hypothetical protein